MPSSTPQEFAELLATRVGPHRTVSFLGQQDGAWRYSLTMGTARLELQVPTQMLDTENFAALYSPIEELLSVRDTGSFRLERDGGHIRTINLRLR